jgi:hypothetical protein
MYGTKYMIKSVNNKMQMLLYSEFFISILLLYNVRYFK